MIIRNNLDLKIPVKFKLLGLCNKKQSFKFEIILLELNLNVDFL